jgi:HSP20 family molecular chaperone IbpA
MFEEVEPTIERVEKLYRTVTGQPAPAEDGVYAPIPPEKDPQKYVEQQLERLLAALEARGASALPQTRWTPSLSIFDRPDHVLICLDLPGVKKEQVQVELLPGMIAVSGHRTPRVDEAGGAIEPVRRETPVGQFSRFIPFAAAPGAQVAAQLNDGVLEIRVPRARTHSDARRVVAVS